MDLAPILLFVYNRPRHTKETVEALQKNELAEMSELFIFSDGPKGPEDEKAVNQVREFVRSIKGFKEIHVIEQEKNRGLANSIISGVTEIINTYGRIIVMEDDLISSPYFLKFMNEALEFYKDDERVINIHGYIFPVKAELPATFFIKDPGCWGWATWERGWRLFEHSGQKLLDELRAKKLTNRFDYDGSYAYTKMLRDQVRGKNDSWAVRWYASAFLKDKLTLYPGKSLVCNIGIDGSGTHCDISDIFETEMSRKPVRIETIPFKENAAAREAIIEYFRTSRPSLARRVRGLIRRTLSRYA